MLTRNLTKEVSSCIHQLLHCIWVFFSFLQNNFPLIETLLDLGADGSVGKTNTNGSQVLHLQAEKADDIDLSELYPDATVVSIVCTMMQVRDLHFGAYNI